MDKPKDGGPAFPVGLLPGMSLRDYFAGQALVSITTEGLRLDQMQGIAKRAYRIADAMLAEREKERK